MSIYAALDGEIGNQLGSNTGWGAFLRWAGKLPAKDYGQVIHLVFYGWCQNLDALSSQLAAALKAKPPDADTAGVARAVLASLAEGGDVLTITNGIGSAGVVDATASSRADLEACGGPGSGVPGPCPGEGRSGGKAKEPKAPAPPRTPAKDPLTKKIEQAQTRVEKAKNGLIKAKKDLADLKARQKTEKAAAKQAVAKVAAKAPVDAGKHTTETKALFNRANQQGSKLTEAEIDKHVAGLGKALNKGQVLEVARGININAPKTKAAALHAIRTTVYNSWRVANRVEEMGKTYGLDKGKGK